MNSKITVRFMGKNFEIPKSASKNYYIFVMEGQRHPTKSHNVAVSWFYPKWSEEKHVWVPYASYTVVGTLPVSISPLKISMSLETVEAALLWHHEWKQSMPTAPKGEDALGVRLAGKTFEVPKEFQDGFVFMGTVQHSDGAVVMASNSIPDWSTVWGWVPTDQCIPIGVIGESVTKHEMFDSLMEVRHNVVVANNNIDKRVVEAVSKGMASILPASAKVWWNRGSKSKETQTPIEELRVYTWGNGKHKYMRINGIKYEVIGGSLVEVDVKCFLYPNEENHSGFRYLSNL